MAEPNDPQQLGTPGEPCSSCGAPLAEDQRYCLNCGHRRGESRVPFPEALASASAESAPSPPPSDGATPLPASWTPTTSVLSVGAIALVLGVGVLIGRSVTKDSKRTAAAPQVISVGGAGAQSSTATGTGAAFKSDWPAGKDGWTVQLQALPKDSTQPPAVAAAKSAASGKGAQQVGALDSDEYPSLDSGQYVIYSGIYSTQKDAQKALAGVKKNFPGAKVVHVSRNGGATGKTNTKGATTLSPNQLKDLGNATGSDYFKKAQKLPKVIATPGAPPPKDNKAPGGGSGGGQAIQ